MSPCTLDHQVSSVFWGHVYTVLLAGVFGTTSIACSRSTAPELGSTVPVRVAAAADLTRAFEELGRDFQRDTHVTVVFSFGSTGLLAKQLREGAPFDVFAAANESFVEDVVKAGACDETTKARYARGRIAWWTRKQGVVPPATLTDLADPRFVRIAIANPEHAPYGTAAREALKSVGIWSQVGPRLVLGENVRQTLQFAETGNVEVAIVALALVVHDTQNPWTLVPDNLHPPIDQALAVCIHGANRKGGEAFVRHVNSEAGRAVMRRHGFLLPGETVETTP